MVSMAMREALPAPGERSQDLVASDPVRDQRVVLPFADSSRSKYIRPVSGSSSDRHERSQRRIVSAWLAADRGDSLAVHRLLANQLQCQSCVEPGQDQLFSVGQASDSRGNGSRDCGQGPAGRPGEVQAEYQGPENVKPAGAFATVLFWAGTLTGLGIIAITWAAWKIIS